MRFQPSRLTEAREARDLTMTALADIIGRKPASISHYENGRHEPPPEVVAALADALNVRPGFFYLSPRQGVDQPTFFRSMAAATKRARTRAFRRTIWTADILSYVESYVDIRRANLPESPTKDWKTLRSEDIENAATRLRRHWGLGDGPIPNLVWLVEHHGIVVVRDSIGDRHLDAHSRWCADRPIIVLNSDKRSAVRSRFDCAHELGHLVLHQSVSATELKTSEFRKDIEGQADRFASAFMLPAESFAEEVDHVSLDALLALKLRWKMSVAAMIKRCQRLGFVSKEGATRLWRARSRRGWNKREPYDDSILPEHPRMLARAFEMIAHDQLASREGVMAATHLESSDIESLACLGKGYLSGTEAKVVQFQRIRLES